MDGRDQTDFFQSYSNYKETVFCEYWTINLMASMVPCVVYPLNEESLNEERLNE